MLQEQSENSVPSPTPQTPTPTPSTPSARRSGCPRHHCGPCVVKITLREIEIDWQNISHDITISKADNLFDSAPPPGYRCEPIPTKGRLASATFDFTSKTPSGPTNCIIRPPGDLTLEFPADAHRVLPWLDRSRFRVLRRLARTIALLLLAIAGAFSPGFETAI